MKDQPAFDEDFRRLIAPLLVGSLQAEAAHVAFGTYDFDAAVCEVMVVACQHGAGYLSDTAFLDLRDWVTDQLAAVLDQELAP